MPNKILIRLFFKDVQGVYIEIYRIGIHRIWHELLTEMITLFAYTMLVRLHFGAP